MKHIVVLVFIVLFMLAGCAAREEPVTYREPKKLITKDDYEDLKIKEPEEKPVEVDYKKEGVYRQNFEPLPKK